MLHFLSNFSPNPQLLDPQYIHKPHPVGLSSKHSSAFWQKSPKNVGFYPPHPLATSVFLPFVDRENNQLLWQTPLARCTIPTFLIPRLNSRTEIFLARIHFVCQKLIGFIHLLDPLSNLIKKVYCSKKILLPTNQ